MHDLVNQRAPAGRDVHHHRVVLARIVAIRRAGALTPDAHGVVHVALLVFEEPDVDDLLRVILEVGILQLVDRPAHGADGAPLHHRRRFVAHHHERPFDDDRELGRQLGVQRLYVGVEAVLCLTLLLRRLDHRWPHAMCTGDRRFATAGAQQHHRDQGHQDRGLGHLFLFDVTRRRKFLASCASSSQAREAGSDNASRTDLARSRGHQLLATDINVDALRGRWPDTVLTERLDVTDAADWLRVLAVAKEAWGGLDVLYNIAGYLHPGYVHEIALAEVDRHFDINTKGVAYGTCTAAALMAEQGSGHIINIASMAAFAPISGNALYCASKYAVRAFSLAAATDLRRQGIHVTVVCPDAVATPMLDKQKDFKEAALTFTAPTHPHRRRGRRLSDGSCAARQATGGGAAETA